MASYATTSANHYEKLTLSVPEAPRPDLADHFLSCSKLRRYLTVADGSRFVITDDFRESPVQPEAAAVASIYSKDLLVAQAALLPLGSMVHEMSALKRGKYEHLFTLIEEQALSSEVKNTARELLDA